MMVSRPEMQLDEEMYSDSELGEEEEYSEEIADEFESDEAFVPRTFEDFQTLYKQQFDPTAAEKPVQKLSPEPETDEGPMSQEEDYEPEEEEHEEFSGEAPSALEVDQD
jgi:hypothetical protein